MTNSATSYLATCVKVGGQEICDAFPTVDPTGTPGADNAFMTIGDVISRVMVFMFPIAGIILFIVLVAAGFEYMNSAGESSKIDSAWKKITYSLLGFGLLLVSFFLVRTVAMILGLESPI